MFVEVIAPVDLWIGGGFTSLNPSIFQGNYEGSTSFQRGSIYQNSGNKEP